VELNAITSTYSRVRERNLKWVSTRLGSDRIWHLWLNVLRALNGRHRLRSGLEYASHRASANRGLCGDLRRALVNIATAADATDEAECRSLLDDVGQLVSQEAISNRRAWLETALAKDDVRAVRISECRQVASRPVSSFIVMNSY
jgi:hypothetical protein